MFLLSFLLLLVACDPGAPLGPGPHTPVIFHGDEPDRPEHAAVVALLERHGVDGYASAPFCSGTLIDDRLVLTAAHCTDHLVGPHAVAVYVGDDPGAESALADHVHHVEAVVEHPDWDRHALTHDLAVLRLEQSMPGPIPRIPPLPAELGFTEADVGRVVDIAGFGYQEDGAYGEKLHVEVPIAGFGCGAVGSCGRFPDRPDLQVAYRQPGPPANGGPCNGDSGGPLLVRRDGAVHVGGVTSWGDASCRAYGISARADEAAAWLEDPFGLAGPPLEQGVGFTINELLPDPSGHDAEREWVEIVNVDTSPDDLAGWSLVDAAGHVVALPAGVVAPGQAVVVEGTLSLNNGAERIELVTPGGTVLEWVEWAGTEEGTSLNRRVDGDWDSPLVPHPEAVGAVGARSPGARVDGSPW